MFRARVYCRSTAVSLLAFFVFALISLKSIVALSDDLSWQYGEGASPENDGRMAANLDYGIPETDAVQVRVTCSAQASGAPMLDSTFGTDVDGLKNDDVVNVGFFGKGFAHSVPGTVVGIDAEYGITGVKLTAGIEDPLWRALEKQDKLEYRIEGKTSADLDLKKGRRQVRNFVEACESYDKREPIETAEKKEDAPKEPVKTAEAKPEEPKAETGKDRSVKPKKTAETKTEKKEEPKPESEPVKKEEAKTEKKEEPKPEPKAEKKAETKPEPAASSGIDEKEAFAAAKELGTIEAWEAFLENFPKGFRADLARAYVKRIGGGEPKADAKPKKTEAAPKKEEPEKAEAPPPPPPPPAPPADISLAITTQGACRGGRNCSVTVTATNTGGQIYSGPLAIATSVAPGGANLQGTGTPPFACEDLGGGAVCSHYTAQIGPGQSTILPITFKLPRNAGGQITTCANIAWGGVPAGLGPREVQRKLNELGFKAGPADGRPGPQTFRAVKRYQAASGLSQSGQLDLPLYLSLFSPGGVGDANPANDQACAGAAVTSATPLPAPAAIPAWQPPRGYKKVRKPAPTGKCSSRSVWLEGQCILKSAVTSFCGPGFRRQGSRCVSNAPTPPPSGPTVTSCPAGQLQVGNSCINLSIAPVFGRPGRPQGGGQATTQGGQQATQTGQQCPSGQQFVQGFGCAQKWEPTLGVTPPGSSPQIQVKPTATTGSQIFSPTNVKEGNWKPAVAGKCPAGKELINRLGKQFCASKRTCPVGTKLLHLVGKQVCATPAQIAAQNAKVKADCDKNPGCVFPALGRACPHPLVKGEGLCLCPKPQQQRWNGKTCVARGGQAATQTAQRCPKGQTFIAGMGCGTPLPTCPVGELQMPDGSGCSHRFGTKTCGGMGVLRPNGQCNCGSRNVFRNGQCVPNASEKARLDALNKEAKNKKCPPGQVVMIVNNNRVICDAGLGGPPLAGPLPVAPPPPGAQGTNPNKLFDGQWTAPVGGKCPSGKVLIVRSGKQYCARAGNCPPGTQLIHVDRRQTCMTPSEIANANKRAKVECDTHPGCAFPAFGRACPAPLIKSSGLCACPNYDKQRWTGSTCVASGGGQQQPAPPPTVKKMTKGQMEAELIAHCRALSKDPNRQCKREDARYITNKIFAAGGDPAKALPLAKAEISARAAQLNKQQPAPPPIIKGKSKHVVNCVGGQRSGNTCRCPAGQVAVLTSKTSNAAGSSTSNYRCQAQRQIQPVPPKRVVQCNGGQLVGNQCRCSGGQVATKTGSSLRPDGSGTDVFQCVCPGDTRKVGNQCVKTGIQCAPHMKPQGNKCVSRCGIGSRWNGRTCIQDQSKTQTKEIICPPGTGLVPKNGRCDCPTGLKWDGKTCKGPQKQQAKPRPVINICQGGAQKVGNTCRCPGGQAPQLVGTDNTRIEIRRLYQCPNQQPQIQQQRVNCDGGGRVVNGVCVCPPNRPRFENGKCKKPKGSSKFLQQLQQQQQQQQQRPQQRQCPPGMVQLPSGQCGCPGGQQFINGRCVYVQQQQQPQQGLTPQQQQQLQQGINQLKNLFSDERLKRDIELVSTREDGLKLYSFRYLWDDRVHVGVMAQDLLSDPTLAHAVSRHESGYYMVNYGALGLRMEVLQGGLAR